VEFPRRGQDHTALQRGYVRFPPRFTRGALPGVARSTDFSAGLHAAAPASRSPRGNNSASSPGANAAGNQACPLPPNRTLSSQKRDRSAAGNIAPRLLQTRFAAASLSAFFFKSLSPDPVFALTGTSGATLQKRSAQRNSSASIRTNSSVSLSHHVALRQRDHAKLHSQQPANIENARVSAALMDSSAAITSKSTSIPAAPASMLLTNLSCSRHVHKTEAHAIFFQKSETQINRDSAALLFRKTIRMRASQRFDQRGICHGRCARPCRQLHSSWS